MGIGDRLRALTRRQRADDLEDDDSLEADDDAPDNAVEESSPAEPSAGSEVDDEDEDGLDDDDDAGDDEEADEVIFAEERSRWRRWMPFGFAGASTIGFVAVVVAGWYVASPGLERVPRIMVELPARGGPVESLMEKPAPTAPAALTPAPRDQKPLAAQLAANEVPQPASPPAADKPPGDVMNRGGGPSAMVSPVTVAAYAGLPAKAAGKPLAEAPDPALVEQGGEGLLPKSAGKKEPWRAYAAPAASARGARVAILVEGLGLSRVETEVAIDRLPGAVSLSFSPYASDAAVWYARSRQNGHETYVGLPMEAERFPTRDPGPLALLTSLSGAENVKKLETVLSRGSGYVGVSSVMGERFLASPNLVRPVFEALRTRGLAYIDVNPDGGGAVDKVGQDVALPMARARVRLDEPPSRTGLDARLAELEAAARKEARAVAVCRPYPVTMERVANWIRTLDGKGITLVPVSALFEEAKAP